MTKIYIVSYEIESIRFGYEKEEKSFTKRWQAEERYNEMKDLIDNLNDLCRVWNLALREAEVED